MSRYPISAAVRSLRGRLGRLWRGSRLRTWQSRHRRYLRALEQDNSRLCQQSASSAPGRLFVVVNIDTEGPCQWCQNKDWQSIEREVQQGSSREFRHRFADSAGRPLALSWFVVHWVGAEHSARGRDLGFHKVYDRYRKWVDQLAEDGLSDEIYWHYHHVLPGNVESSNRDWSHFPQYEETLSRLLLERQHFPACYRAGNTWEDNAASRWLEHWLPLDFSNRAPQRGQNFDWSRAPTEWSVYSPNPEDVQRPGAQQRVMARSLSIENGWFRAPEIEAAFLRAQSGQDSYVSFFTHDYKDMTEQIRRGMELIGEQAARYPEVEIHNASAGEALRRLCGGERRPLRLDASTSPAGIELRSTAPIHGSQPWVAARSNDGRIHRLDTEQIADQHRWLLSADQLTDITELAAGCADPAGNTATIDLTAELHRAAGRDHRQQAS